VNSLSTAQGRKEASRRYHENLKSDPSYETVNGNIQPTLDSLLKKCDGNFKFFILVDSNKQALGALLSYIRLKNQKIKRDYGQ